jgi:hypothetical protein
MRGRSAPPNSRLRVDPFGRSGSETAKNNRLPGDRGGFFALCQRVGTSFMICTMKTRAVGNSGWGYNIREMSEIFDQIPPVTGTPVIDGPKILEWPSDRDEEGPFLSEPTANLINDLHADLTRCDMVLTTSGNYHMALKELWKIYRSKFPPDDPLRDWIYTTSPPLAKQQIECGLLAVGNVTIRSRPQIAVGPRPLVDLLAASRFATGKALAICKSRGNVLLVKKGNPQNIRSIWDLGREDVRVVTPNPSYEPGAFRLYANSLFGIAKYDLDPPRRMTAEGLFRSIFGRSLGGRRKWLAGSRIHHREVPWSVAYGKGDVAIFFYHLAVHAASTFPDLFEIIPLGGTIRRPKPLQGNMSEVLYAVEIEGKWSNKQRAAMRKLMELFRSKEWASLLKIHGLDSP